MTRSAVELVQCGGSTTVVVPLVQVSLNATWAFVHRGNETTHLCNV